MLDSKELKKNYQDAVKKLKLIDTQKTLGEWKTLYLGKDSPFYQTLKTITKRSIEERKVIGKLANQQIQQLKDAYQSRLQQLKRQEWLSKISREQLDLTAPFGINAKVKGGFFDKPAKQHPLLSEARHILDIGKYLGFEIHQAQELDDDYNNFTALNMGPGHPAREGWDTFYTEEGLIPAVHVSNMQNRIMRNANGAVKALVYGKVARNEKVDASHGHTFTYIEGIYIDTDATIRQLIGTLDHLLKIYFGKELESQIQPSHFPFVEPGIEYMIKWQTEKHDKWLEILGAGMVHPQVISEAGLDPKRYNGFAWGFGVDRLVMLKYELSDIRWLMSSDLRFLEKF